MWCYLNKIENKKYLEEEKKYHYLFIIIGKISNLYNFATKKCIIIIFQIIDLKIYFKYTPNLIHYITCKYTRNIFNN